LFLSISNGTAESVPRERVPDAEPDDAGSAGTDTVPSAIEYPEDPAADLVIVDDNTSCLLDETAKLVANTYVFFLVVNMDGIAPLDDVDTLQSTWVSFSMDEEFLQMIMCKLSKTKSFRQLLQGPSELVQKAPVLASAA
jgi:hypothetical protein